MTEKILFVDDEQNVLDGLRRQLRKTFFVETALGPVEGLQAVNKKGPFAVVVSDLRMPVMDGIKFLIRVKERTPDSVRMVLTGNADQESAIKAVNDGHIFRFLTKPCPTEVLVKVLKSGIEQYQLVRAERDLLEQTLKGSVKILTEILSMLNPEAFARASRITRQSLEIAFFNFGVTEPWKMETAAMLSQIGLMTLPGQSLEKLYQGHPLSLEEQALFDRHPQIGSDLLKHIPRLEDVAEIIRCQNQSMDQKDGFLPLEARILKVVLDFDIFFYREKNIEKALEKIREHPEKYDPGVLEALEKNLESADLHEPSAVMIEQLRPGMIMNEDLRTLQGLLLVAAGQELGPAIIERLCNFKQTSGNIPEPIQVLTSVKR